MQDLGHGRFDAFVGVRDHEVDAAPAAPGEAAQEVGPEWLGFGWADREAQHLVAAVTASAIIMPTER